MVAFCQMCIIKEIDDDDDMKVSCLECCCVVRSVNCNVMTLPGCVYFHKRIQ